MTEHKTLVQALTQAQSEMDHAELDENNTQFDKPFASLKSIINAVKPALNKNGVWFVQKSHPTDSGIAIETVFYGYGEEISTGPIPVPAQKATPQGYGSAVTYAKRYSLAMACGISAAQDDDANSAEQETPASVDFTDLEAPTSTFTEAPAPQGHKRLIDHNPKTKEDAIIAVDALIDMVRGMCQTEDEVRSMVKGNPELTNNLEINYPDERLRLRTAMVRYIEQLGETT